MTSDLFEMAAKNNLTVVEDASMQQIDKVYQERLSIALELCEVEDPSTEPYKSKYAARDIFQKLHDEMLGQKIVFQVNGKSKDSEILADKVAFLDYKLGKIAMDTEESHNAESFLINAIDRFLPHIGEYLMKNYTEKNKNEKIKEIDYKDLLINQEKVHLNHFPECTIDVLNLLGILWTGRELHQRAVASLEIARSFFLLLNEKDSKTDKILSYYIHTLFYLAQVWGLLEQPEKSAIYCFETLDLQLKTKNKFSTVQWTSNCIKLAEYYIGLHSYQQAADLLVACDKVTTEEKQNLNELKQTFADVSLTWGKLYLSILKEAKEYQLIESAQKPITEKEIKSVRFSHLQEDSIQVVYPKDIKDFVKARDIFKKALTGFQQAHCFYVLDGYVTEHVSISQSISSLYNSLIAFESDERRILAMQNRRALLLSPFLKDLNSKIYSSLLKQISFELGEIYSEMMEYKLNLLDKKEEKPSFSDLEKCNTIGKQSIESFEFFIQLYETEKEKGKEIPSLEDYEKGPFLRAHFYISRMYGKLIFSSKEETVKALGLSLKRYEKTVELSKKYEGEKTKVFSSEFSLCQEMIQLLPEKINRIHYSRT